MQKVVSMHLSQSSSTSLNTLSFFCSFFVFNFIYFIFEPAGSSLHAGFYLVAVSGGCSPGGLLVAVAPLAESMGKVSIVVAPGLYGTGSIAVAHGLRCSVACWVFPDQGLNPCLLHWQADSLPLNHQGSHIFSSPWSVFCHWLQGQPLSPGFLLFLLIIPFLLPSVSPSNSHCQVDVLHREPSSVNKHVFAKLHPQFMHVIIAQLIHL